MLLHKNVQCLFEHAANGTSPKREGDVLPVARRPAELELRRTRIISFIRDSGECKGSGKGEHSLRTNRRDLAPGTREVKCKLKGL
jgi:hypothetical protein